MVLLYLESSVLKSLLGWVQNKGSEKIREKKKKKKIFELFSQKRKWRNFGRIQVFSPQANENAISLIWRENSGHYVGYHFS